MKGGSRSPLQHAAASMLAPSGISRPVGNSAGSRHAAKASKHLEAALGFADRHSVQSSHVIPHRDDFIGLENDRDVSSTMARINAALGLTHQRTNLEITDQNKAITKRASRSVGSVPKLRTSSSAPGGELSPSAAVRLGTCKGRAVALAAADAARRQAQEPENWMYKLQMDEMKRSTRKLGRPGNQAPAPTLGHKDSDPHPEVLRILGPPPKGDNRLLEQPAPTQQPLKVRAGVDARTNWKSQSMGTTNARLRRKIGYFVKKHIPPLLQAGLAAAVLRYRRQAAVVIIQCAVRQWRRQQRHLRMLSATAVVMQCACRCHLARRARGAAFERRRKQLIAARLRKEREAREREEARRREEERARLQKLREEAEALMCKQRAEQAAREAKRQKQLELEREERLAAMRIQCRWRISLAMRAREVQRWQLLLEEQRVAQQRRAAHERRARAAVAVQCAVRACLARLAVQRVRRARHMRQTERDFRARVAAARAAQTACCAARDAARALAEARAYGAVLAAARSAIAAATSALGRTADAAMEAMEKLQLPSLDPKRQTAKVQEQQQQDTVMNSVAKILPPPIPAPAPTTPSKTAGARKQKQHETAQRDAAAEAAETAWRKLRAAVRVQKIFRGHKLRRRLHALATLSKFKSTSTARWRAWRHRGACARCVQCAWRRRACEMRAAGKRFARRKMLERALRSAYASDMYGNSGDSFGSSLGSTSGERAHVDVDVDVGGGVADGEEAPVCEWQEYVDSATGRSYFFNAREKITTWDRPAVLVSSHSHQQQLQQQAVLCDRVGGCFGRARCVSTRAEEGVASKHAYEPLSSSSAGSSTNNGGGRSGSRGGSNGDTNGSILVLTQSGWTKRHVSASALRPPPGVFAQLSPVARYCIAGCSAATALTSTLTSASASAIEKADAAAGGGVGSGLSGSGNGSSSGSSSGGGGRASGVVATWLRALQLAGVRAEEEATRSAEEARQRREQAARQRRQEEQRIEGEREKERQERAALEAIWTKQEEEERVAEREQRKLEKLWARQEEQERQKREGRAQRMPGVAKAGWMVNKLKGKLAAKRDEL